MTCTRLALATVLALAFTPLAAQDFQKGLSAYNAGDYTTALQEWTPLAEAMDIHMFLNFHLILIQPKVLFYRCKLSLLD